DHRDRGAPVVPEQRVEVGDVHDRDVVAVGQRVPGVRHVAAGRVVLHVDRGQVAADAAAQQAFGQVQFVRALREDEVYVGVAQPLPGHLHGVVRPRPGGGAAPAVGT